jgi:hypothetical protein
MNPIHYDRSIMTELPTEKDTIRTEGENTLYAVPYYNSLINTNNQLITNALEIATESVKIFNQHMLNLMKLNISVMRMSWIQFLYFAQPRSENEE